MISIWAWLTTSAIVAILIWVLSRVFPKTPLEAARRIEQAFPSLDSRLLAAIEQRPAADSGKLNILQRQVIEEALLHARANDWNAAVPNSRMWQAFLRQTAAFVAFLVIGFLSTQFVGKSAEAIATKTSESRPVATSTSIEVEPGNAILERGTSVLILARFQGNPPANVQVIWIGDEGIEHRLPLAKSLDDPVFASRLPPLKDNIHYRIDFDGQQSTDYTIEVFDLPALVRSDLTLTFPSYTQLPEKRLVDALEATVVEGSEIKIRCEVNKQITSAKLTGEDGSPFLLQSEAADPNCYSISFTPSQSMRLKLELVDLSGRSNRDPEQFRIEVIPNRTPDLSLTFPGKDVKASPLEEIQIEATAIDDFGIIEAGLVVEVAGREPIINSLAKDLKAGEQHKISTIEQLEELRVHPDELISFYIYAYDYGPNGEKRQTNSDLFFAEVRHFDEIYRQLDQKSPFEIKSQPKPPENLGKLIEIQRQIVVATWKLARTPEAAWTPNSLTEVTAIRSSQQLAADRLQVLREKMSQPQFKPIFSQIADAMETALRELDSSLESNEFRFLRTAVTAEQSAYQGLLKLRAKEHLMIQSQGSGNSSEQAEKLDLELERKKDRYESEKAGTKKEESNINREALAILDQLKELALRQEGINQLMKDLDAQMRQAKSEIEREDAERQLKRLREEQQQLLRDSDELRNKLNKSLQAEAIKPIKDQLEQTRQRMVETSEKLREDQLSQAINSGTRSERELKQLAEDFRKQTAARFAEALRDLRQEARQLAEQEMRLQQKLNHQGDDSRRSLRQSQERAQLQNEFQQQKENLNEILEQVKKVVESSESAEPLLSKQLYDTLRATRDQQLEQAITATQALLKQGIIPEAAKAEKQVQSGIKKLQQGIEKAAESVLGSEVESLKRARRELAALSAEVEKEIQANEQTDSTGNTRNGQPARIDGPTISTDASKVTDQTNRSNSSNPLSQASSDDSASKSGSPNQQVSKSTEPGPNRSAGGNGNSGSSESNTATTDANSSAFDPRSQEAKPSGRRSLFGLRSKSKPGTNSPTAGREGESDANSEGGGAAGSEQGGGPISGSDFSEFNERLRDVESMVSDPKLQSEIQKVRDRARSIRAEFKRHTTIPNWDFVQTSIHQPMIELQKQIAEEIAKREQPDSLVPVDRDPVPTRYRDLVRLYYERLGAGKDE